MQGWHSSQEHLLTRRRWPAHPSRAECPSWWARAWLLQRCSPAGPGHCSPMCSTLHPCSLLLHGCLPDSRPPNASQPADTQPVSDGGRMMRHSPAQGSVPSSLLHDCVWGAESRRQPHSLQLSGLKHLLCPQQISLSPLASVDVDADADGKEESSIGTKGIPAKPAAPVHQLYRPHLVGLHGCCLHHGD